MSVLREGHAPPAGPGTPRRTVAIRLLLLVGLLLTALVVAVLPRGAAQDTGTVEKAKDTYYTLNGTCYVESEVATGLTGAGAKRFEEQLTGMLGKLGHKSNYTFNNGTVTITATAVCPEGTGNSIVKEVLTGWIQPALGVLGGLAFIVAASLAFTASYQKITGHGVDPESQVQYLLTSFGGSLSTALLSFIVAGGTWQPAVSSGIAAFFTTYLVSAYKFQGLQDILNTWITAAYAAATAVAVAAGKEAGAAVKAIKALRTDLLEYLAQVRA